MTWEQGQDERREGEELEREREIREGLADPDAHHQMVFSQLDCLI